MYRQPMCLIYQTCSKDIKKERKKEWTEKEEKLFKYYIHFMQNDKYHAVLQAYLNIPLTIHRLLAATQQLPTLHMQMGPTWETWVLCPD